LSRTTTFLGPVLALGCLAGGAAPLAAQSPPPPGVSPRTAGGDDNPIGWAAKAGLSYVATGGNAEASTLGFKFNASYNWTRTFFTLQGGGVRSDSETRTVFAVGTGQDFVVNESTVTGTTAENYFLEAGLDRNSSARFFWQAGLGWLRNTFAGVESREAFRGGAGYIWTDPASKGAQLKTALLATFTHQKEVKPDPTADDAFVGARLVADLSVPFGRNSFNSRANLDENFQTTDDFRVTWWNSLGFSITNRLALQVSLLLYYDHRPALREVPLYDVAAGGQPVGPPAGTALVPVRKGDRELAVSFVLNIAPKKPTAAPTGAQ